MTAKSPAQRQALRKAKLIAQGLCQHKVLCRTEHKAQITEYAKQLRLNHRKYSNDHK